MSHNSLKLTSLARDSLIMMIWQGVRLVSSYVFLWLLYIELPPQEIAPYSNFLTLTALAVPVFLLKPEALVGRAFFEKSKTDFDTYAGSVIGVVVLGSILAGLLILVLARDLMPLTGIAPLPMLLLVPYLLGYGLLYVSSTIIQLEHRPLTFAALRGVEGILRLVIGAMLVWYGLGWKGPLIALVAAMVLTALLSEITMRYFTNYKVRPNLIYARSYLVDGAPTVPMTLAAAALQSSDRFAVTAFLGLTAAGVYGVASILVSGVWILANSFQQVWMPWLFATLSNPNTSDYKKATSAIIVFSAVMCAISLFVVFIVKLTPDDWIDPRYIQVKEYIVPLALAFLAMSLRLVFDNVFYFYKRVWWLAYVLVTAALISTTSAWIFTQSFGAVAAAWSFAAGSIFGLVATASLAWKFVAESLI